MSHSRYFGIGEAIKALNEGKRITYGTWYGNNQYVYKKPVSEFIYLHHKHDGTVTAWMPTHDELASENFTIYTRQD